MLVFGSQELDRMTGKGCSNPDCDCVSTEIFLHGKCGCPGNPEVIYDTCTATLKLQCGVCNQHIINIAVADVDVMEIEE